MRGKKNTKSKENLLFPSPISSSGIIFEFRCAHRTIVSVIYNNQCLSNPNVTCCYSLFFVSFLLHLVSYCLHFSFLSSQPDFLKILTNHLIGPISKMVSNCEIQSQSTRDMNESWKNLLERRRKTIITEIANHRDNFFSPGFVYISKAIGIEYYITLIMYFIIVNDIRNRQNLDEMKSREERRNILNHTSTNGCECCVWKILQIMCNKINRYYCITYIYNIHKLCNTIHEYS